VKTLIARPRDAAALERDSRRHCGAVSYTAAIGATDGTLETRRRDSVVLIESLVNVALSRKSASHNEQKE
jgi:hypothetical protein